MLSTSFTMEGGQARTPALSPTYTDCDRVIQDIYAMTRRRPYLSSTPRRQVGGGSRGEGGEDGRARSGVVRTMQCGLLAGPRVGGQEGPGRSRMGAQERSGATRAREPDRSVGSRIGGGQDRMVNGGPPSSRVGSVLHSMRMSQSGQEKKSGLPTLELRSMPVRDTVRAGPPALGSGNRAGLGLDLAKYGVPGLRTSMDMSVRAGPVRGVYGSQTVRSGGAQTGRQGGGGQAEFSWAKPQLRRGHTDLDTKVGGTKGEDTGVKGLEAGVKALGLGGGEEAYSHSRISAIQSRPLPPPAEPIYHSPVKPSPSRPLGSSQAKQTSGSQYQAKQTSGNQAQARQTPTSIPRPEVVSQTRQGERKVESRESRQTYTGASNTGSSLGTRSSNTGTSLGMRNPNTGVNLGVRASTQLDLILGPREETIRRGLLWVQEDKLFSRWRERFIVLTSSYLMVHKKAASRISEMGAFLYKVTLSEVTSAALEDRRGYLTLVLTCRSNNRLLLRRTEGIREWQCAVESLLGRVTTGAMASTRDFWSRRQFSDCQGAQEWLLARQRTGHNYSLASSEATSLAPTSTPYFFPSSSTEEDSGLESMVTTTSDSSSNSSRSPPPPPPQQYKLYTEL